MGHQGGNDQNKLREGLVHAMSHDKCRNDYSYDPSEIDDSHQCAMSAPGEPVVGYCTGTGDRGGPLMCKNYMGDWTLYGVYSWTHGNCGNNNYPGVFGRTAMVADWINAAMDSTMAPTPPAPPTLMPTPKPTVPTC